MTTLYHYCPAPSFLSIIQNRSIWLSSLTQSNDSMEGLLLKNTFLELFQNQNHSKEVIKRIQLSIDILNEIIDGLGFCLSRNGDLLSQWRGYASDGEGFSIGFSKDYLTALEKSLNPKVPGFKLLKVSYKSEEHKKALMPVFNEIRSTIESTPISKPRPTLLTLASPDLYESKMAEFDKLLKVIQKKTLKVLPQLFALKHQAFSEEKEFRLVSHLIKDTEDSCQFHTSNNKIIPHREFKLIDLSINPVVEIILGPKNQTPDYVIKKLLNSHGFQHTNIKRSSATYR